MSLLSRNKNKKQSAKKDAPEKAKTPPVAKPVAPPPPPDPVDPPDPIFLAVLGGLISKYGALDGDGNPAISLLERAEDFAREAKKRNSQ